LGVLASCAAATFHPESIESTASVAMALARQNIGLTMQTPLIICLQHSKAVPGDHDLNRVGDAIVIGLRNASEVASGGIRRRS
jgi:hypothetical protein